MSDIETIGDARDAGWALSVRCDRRREGLKSVRPCILRQAYLDLDTMLWPQGRTYPIGRLQGRVRCPICRTLHVFLIWTWQSVPDLQRRAG